MSTNRDRYELDTDPRRIDAYLREQGWLGANEYVDSAEIAGEGNMNRTVRARMAGRSVILKQSQPWCVKFPDIPAPVERIAFEVEFYRIARRSPLLAERTPEVLDFDPDAHVAMMEDLGSASDLMGLYAGDELAPDDLALLCELARELHALPLTADERKSLRNADMRALNHEHIFELPLRPENGLDLEAHTAGLSQLADELKRDDAYLERVAACGRIYLEAEGPALLHGDYYPGSFLQTSRGLALIDPEFGFSGPVEFDLGVLAAHLRLASAGDDILERITRAYARAVDESLLAAFAGAEMMRRLIGVSQLPLSVDLDAKRRLLERSRSWVLGVG